MKRRRFIFAILPLLFLFAPLDVRADDVPSQVTASITSKENIWVGEKVTLAIDLLAPGYFAGTPKFDFPKIPGVLLIPPEDHPILATKQINDQSYTVQHYEVLLFAKRAGTFEVPAFKIRFGIKRSPLDQDATPQEILTPELNFTAKFPPGAENLTSLVSARDLDVVAKWQPLPHSCKVGDAFTETITYTASDIPGMAFPPFPATKIEGLGVYPKTPVISDKSERGELHGNRQDTITYVCERPGRFVIPAAKLTWWNTDDQTLHTIKFPEQVLEVAVNSSPGNQVASWNTVLMRYADQIVASLLAVIVFVAALRWVPWSACREAFGFLRPVHLKPLNPSQAQKRI